MMRLSGDPLRFQQQNSRFIAPLPLPASRPVPPMYLHNGFVFHVAEAPPISSSARRGQVEPRVRGGQVEPRVRRSRAPSRRRSHPKFRAQKPRLEISDIS
jgi:hypothetical protein